MRENDADNEQFDVVVQSWWRALRCDRRRNELAQRRAHSVLLLDKAGRIKPCGGAVPPRLIRDFADPGFELFCAKHFRRHGWSRRATQDRRHADRRWLRRHGRPRRHSTSFYACARRIENGAVRRHRRLRAKSRAMPTQRRRGRPLPDHGLEKATASHARVVIGADGALSQVARQEVAPKGPPYVFAYHEIVEVPARPQNADAQNASDAQKADANERAHAFAATSSTTASPRRTFTAGCFPMARREHRLGKRAKGLQSAKVRRCKLRATHRARRMLDHRCVAKARRFP